MRHSALAGFAFLGGALLLASSAPSQVVPVEPGHILIQHVDSNPMAGGHSTHQRLDAPQLGNIESICVDRNSGIVYFQMMFPPWPLTPASMPSTWSFILQLVPGTGITNGVILPVTTMPTMFGITENGTDLQIDYAGSALVTQDHNFAAGPRIAAVLLGGPTPPPIFTWCPVAFPPGTPGTFGMDFSRGVNNSVVPAGDIVFTGDAGWTGIHHGPSVGAASVTVVPGTALPGVGDDLVVQPDGDWIWFGDAGAPIVRILPFPPHAQTTSLLSVQGMFNNATIPPVPAPFTYGTRAAVCDITGDMYVTCTGGTGGSALFRVDEQLKTATLVLTVGGPNANEGIQDLELGPASFGLGNSVYFTVHDNVGGFEEIWEVSATACCPTPATVTLVPDTTGWNVPSAPAPGPQSISEFPIGSVPKLGDQNFQVALDDPTFACGIRPGNTTMTAITVAAGPAATIPNPLAGFGCFPGTNGHLMVAWPWVIPTNLVPWLGVPAIHPLPIPFNSTLCGAPVWVTGFFIDPSRPISWFALTERLDLVLGT